MSDKLATAEDYAAATFEAMDVKCPTLPEWVKEAEMEYPSLRLGFVALQSSDTEMASIVAKPDDLDFWKPLVDSLFELKDRHQATVEILDSIICQFLAAVCRADKPSLKAVED